MIDLNKYVILNKEDIKTLKLKSVPGFNYYSSIIAYNLNIGIDSETYLVDKEWYEQFSLFEFYCDDIIYQLLNKLNYPIENCNILTLEEVNKWLRENKDTHIHVCWNNISQMYNCSVIIGLYNNYIFDIPNKCVKLYNRYEEGLKDGIIFALNKLIKNGEEN